MNEFGVPTGDIEINMHPNPAKAMMQEQLSNETEMNWFWAAASIVVPVVGSIIGGNRQASAAREEAELRNEAVQRQFEYDTELWEMTKERIQDDRQYAIDEIRVKERNEQRVAAYKDATALADYNYKVQIRNREQQSLNNQYIRSSNIYGLQTTLNSNTARDARENELRKLQEVHAESSFQLQERRIEHMQAEGKLIARGATGRTAGKLVQSNVADLGRQMAMLNESMEAANRNSRAVLKDIQRDKTSADLTAYANRMLAPGVLPSVVRPYETPLAEWLMPRELTDADYGPAPVEGAYHSPSAASNRVWGSTISGIAGTVGSIASNYLR